MLSKLLQTNSKFGLRMSNNNFITSLQQDKCLHSLLLFTSSIAFSTLITRKNILKNENSTSSTISSSLKNFSTSSNDNVEEKKYKKSNVYTRTGDKGKSSLYNGERRSKTDLIFEVLGTTDELNATLGIALEYNEKAKELTPKIIEIQSRLFDIGACVATPADKSSEDKVSKTEFSPTHIVKLEKWIDEIDSKLPPLVHFVLPSGGLCATHFNLARTVCRRSERCIVRLSENQEVNPNLIKYLNRLSDFLFVCSRYAAFVEGKEENVWQMVSISELDTGKESIIKNPNKDKKKRGDREEV